MVQMYLVLWWPKFILTMKFRRKCSQFELWPNVQLALYSTNPDCSVELLLCIHGSLLYMISIVLDP